MRSSNRVILIIDDEPANIDLLKVDLEDSEYDILTACDGAEGWDVLMANKERVVVILLDRMMPNMDGMAFMEKLKADPSVSQKPVIMQTAAAERSQVQSGIEAGVYYYLCKPYDPAIMLSIVHAAITDYANLNRLRAEVTEFKPRISLLENADFKLQTPEEARVLTTFLAGQHDDPKRVVLGISEMLDNAIEHGNLELSYQEKTRLNNEQRYKKEIEKRLSEAPYQDRYVRVKYVRDAQQIRVTIADDGNGFHWEPYLRISPDRATDNHGRGIALSVMMCFDEVHYSEKGNEVTCITKCIAEA